MAKRFYSCSFPECSKALGPPFPVEDLEAWICPCKHRDCPTDTLMEVPFGQRHPRLCGFLKFGLPLLLLLLFIWLALPCKPTGEAREFQEGCLKLVSDSREALLLVKSSSSGYPAPLKEVGGQIDQAVRQSSALSTTPVDGAVLAPDPASYEGREILADELVAAERDQTRAEASVEEIRKQAEAILTLADRAEDVLDQAADGKGGEDSLNPIDSRLVSETTIYTGGANPIEERKALMEKGESLLDTARKKKCHKATKLIQDGLAALDAVEDEFQRSTRERRAAVERSTVQLRKMVSDLRDTARTKNREIDLALGGWSALVGHLKLRLEEQRKLYRDAPVDFVVAGQSSLAHRLVIPTLEAFLFEKRKIPREALVTLREDPLRLAWKEGEVYRSIAVRESEDEQLFRDLGDGQADLIVTARAPSPGEKEALASIGNMESTSCARVIALDAIAIVLPPENREGILSADAVTKLLKGTRTVPFLSQKGEPESRTFTRVIVPATGAKNGYIRPLLNTLAGGSVGSADETPGEVSAAAEVNAVSEIAFDAYSSLPAGTPVASVMPDALSEVSKPGPVPIGTEDYRYTFRVVVYHAEKMKSGMLEDYLNFLSSTEGQYKVGNLGFVDLNLTLQPHDRPQEFVDQLAKAVNLDPDRVLSAQRMSTTLRFRTASKELDLKAMADIDRLVDRFRLLEPDKYVVLAGFTDNTGTFEANQTLSSDRANEVTGDLQTRKVRSDDRIGFIGFSWEHPVDSNESEEGRQRNRRVEIWVLEPKRT